MKVFMLFVPCRVIHLCNVKQQNGLYYIIVLHCTVQQTNFANAQQTKQIYQYKNMKEKLYTTNAVATWYNESC